jgi:hypothetical protein
MIIEKIWRVVASVILMKNVSSASKASREFTEKRT